MNRDQFYADHATRLPARRTFYHRLRRLAEAGTLPLGVATKSGDKWRFDLPNPAFQPEAAQVIVNLIEQASRWPKGETG